MKFIVDGMLGKLTRWLRILGHNAKYSTKLDDNKLIEIAKKEDRVLLTKDLQLYQQATTKGVEAFYLRGGTEDERLAELAARFNIKLGIDITLSRCPKCNAKIRTIPKAKAAKKVEKNTFEHYDEFWKCLKCKQVYWQGAHWQKIGKTLNEAKANLRDLKEKSEERFSVAR